MSRPVVYVLMWGAAACGILSKLVVSVALKRLVKAAGNMNKFQIVYHIVARRLQAELLICRKMRQKYEDSKPCAGRAYLQHFITSGKRSTVSRDPGGAGAARYAGAI